MSKFGSDDSRPPSSYASSVSMASGVRVSIDELMQKRALNRNIKLAVVGKGAQLKRDMPHNLQTINSKEEE
jgi:hypothetical protein